MDRSCTRCRHLHPHTSKNPAVAKEVDSKCCCPVPACIMLLVSSGDSLVTVQELASFQPKLGGQCVCFEERF